MSLVCRMTSFCGLGGGGLPPSPQPIIPAMASVAAATNTPVVFTSKPSRFRMSLRPLVARRAPAIRIFSRAAIELGSPSVACLEPDAVLAFLDGGLRGDALATAEAHLASCEICA